MYVRPFKVIDVINGSVDNITPVTINVNSRTVIVTNPGTTTLYFYPGSTVSTATGFALPTLNRLEIPITADKISIISSAASGTYSIIVCE